jgi:hypothetical protein
MLTEEEKKKLRDITDRMGLGGYMIGFLCTIPVVKPEKYFDAMEKLIGDYKQLRAKEVMD